MTRVIAYIDGFNLYHGLRSKGWRKYYWLDLCALSASLLKTSQTLAGVHYFTSRIKAAGGNVRDMQRQTAYLEALGTLPDVHIQYGHFLEKLKRCHQCGAQWVGYEEKMTDVNIAMQLLADAFDNRFDTALLISADSDLTTPVLQVRSRFPLKRVIVAQPPGRSSFQLAQAATAIFTISETKLRQSQLPAQVSRADGFVLQRPAHWR
ncbi:MAG: NYN domain-containing protein [Burkholderiaceae bacterium]|nr:NYN domain-containing protein [Burkholderiaceae bacterium]